MEKLYKYLYKKQSGFTLVELIVAISVMSILSGVAVPSYITIKNRTRESGTESNMKSIATALELYNIHNDKYPSSEEGTAELKNQGYINDISDLDMWENQYTYESDGANYIYQSSGVDGEAGTEDDIIFQNGTMIADGGYGNSSGSGNGGPSGPASLIASWNMDIGSGNTIVSGDLTGIINGADWIVGGGRKNGKNGLKFSDKSKNNLDIGSSEDLQIVGDMSFSIWFNLDTMPSGNKADTLFTSTASGEQEKTNTLYELEIDSKGDIYYKHEYGKGKDQKVLFKNTGIKDSEWNLITFTRDSASKEVKLYLNGSMIGEALYNNNPTGGSSTRLYIASDRASKKRAINGTIDEFNLYGEVLDDEQIKEYYEINK